MCALEPIFFPSAGSEIDKIQATDVNLAWLSKSMSGEFMRKIIKLCFIPILCLVVSQLSWVEAAEPNLELNSSIYKISLNPQLSIANQNLALLLLSIKNRPGQNYTEFEALTELENRNDQFEFIYRFEEKIPSDLTQVQVVRVMGRGEIRSDGNFYILNFTVDESKMPAEPVLDTEHRVTPAGGVGIGTRPPLDLPEEWQDLLPPLNCKF